MLLVVLVEVVVQVLVEVLVLCRWCWCCAVAL
jgi:hypothetical protein